MADRYANPFIALRHLEQLTNAVLVASSPGHERAAQEARERGATLLDELAERSRRAYRALVWEDAAFESYFVAATPIEELSGLTLGSRPAARGAGSVSLASLRAIPWVFAWSQSRTNLPAWYGVGSAIEGFEKAHGPSATERLQALYRESAFFTGVIDVMEMALAKADMAVAMRYASLAPRPGARRIWRSIRSEYHRTVAATRRYHRSGAAAGRSAHPPALDRASQPVRRLALRAAGPAARPAARAPPAHPDREPLRRLVQLTVSGVAAGLQNTGYSRPGASQPSQGAVLAAS